MSWHSVVDLGYYIHSEKKCMSENCSQNSSNDSKLLWRCIFKKLETILAGLLMLNQELQQTETVIRNMIFDNDKFLSLTK